MANMRVHELAKELNISSKEIIETLPIECEKLGIDKLSDIIGVVD